MRFPFVLRSTYEDLEKDADCMKWSLDKQIEQLLAERKALILRIHAGEQYRESMERRMNDILDDNRILFEGRAKAREELAAAEKKLKELSIMNRSLEARWKYREEKQPEEAESA